MLEKNFWTLLLVKIFLTLLNVPGGNFLFFGGFFLLLKHPLTLVKFLPTELGTANVSCSQKQMGIRRNFFFCNAILAQVLQETKQMPVF